MDKERVHIYPINDQREHTLVGEFCRCQPSVADAGHSVLVIHNAYDGREFGEWDDLEENLGKEAVTNVIRRAGNQ